MSTKVSETTFSFTDNVSPRTISLPGTPLEDDVIIVGFCKDLGSLGISTSGYTTIDASSAVDPTFHLGIKRMGSSPDANVVITHSNSGRSSNGFIQIWRGVDPALSLGSIVTATRATGATGMPNPGSVTVPSPGVGRVFAVGFLDDDDISGSVTAPSGYGDLIDEDTASGSAGATAMMASKAVAAAGSEDPAAFGGPGTDGWTALAFYLPDAAGGGGAEATLSFQQAAYFGGATRTGPNTTWGMFANADTDGGSNPWYEMRTGAGGTGSLLQQGVLLDGANFYTFLDYDETGLAQGTNTIYVRVAAEFGTWDNEYSFTLLRDDSVSNPTVTLVQGPSWPDPIEDAGDDWRIIFDAPDTYSTATDEMRYEIRDAAGGGTLLASGDFTQGDDIVSAFATADTLSSGDNTRYLRIWDGAENASSWVSFVVNASLGVTHEGAAAFVGSSALEAVATNEVPATAALVGAGALEAVGRVDMGAVLALAGAGALVASGALEHAGALALAGAGALEADATNEVPASLALAGDSAMLAEGNIENWGVLALQGAGALEAVGRGEWAGAVTFNGVGALGLNPEVVQGDTLPQPRGQGRVRLDVFDVDGNKMPFGAITSAISARYRIELDRISTFEIALPLSEERAQYIGQRFTVAVHVEDEGLVFIGEVGRIQTQHIGDALANVIIGSSARVLVRRNTLMGMTFEGATLATYAAAMVDDTDYELGELDEPATTILAKPIGLSRWAALEKGAETFGLHLRDNPIQRTVDIGAFGDESGLTFQKVAFSSPTLRQNTDLVPISDFQIVEESEDLINRYLPVGGGEGANQLTLKWSTRTEPYEIQTYTGDDGVEYHYIEDEDSIDDYGLSEEVISIKDAVPLTNSLAGFEEAGNALYDATATALSVNRLPLNRYSFSVAGMPHLVNGVERFKVGQLASVRWEGVAETSEGTRTVYKSVNGHFWIMAVERELLSEGGSNWRIEVASIDRHERDIASRITQTFEQMHALNVQLKNYTFQAPYILQRASINASNKATLYVKLDANISLLHLAKLSWIVRPVKSNVTTAASDSGVVTSTASGGSSSPTTASGGGSSPTTASGGGSSPSTSNGGGTTVASANTDVPHIHAIQVFNGTGYTATSQIVVVRTSPSTGFEHAAGFSANINTGAASAGSHQHNVTIPNHQHTVTIAAHTHSVTIAAHDHTVTIPAHTHGITLPPHSHTLVYGIYVASNPSNPAITITINGVDRTAALGGPWNTVNSEITVDITAYLQSGGTEQPNRATNTVEFGASVLCDVEAIARLDLTRSALIPV